MFCRYCGRKILEDSLFCPYCGKQLSPPEPPVNEPVPRPQESPAVQVHSDKVRWIILGLIVLVLIGAVAALFITKVICFHVWEEATCITPITCVRCQDTQGEALGHTVTDATCTDPITCTTCHETFGRALGHDARKATCTSPARCARCKMTWGKPKEHDWIEETFTTPKTCEDCGAITPMTQPESGTVYIDAKKYYGSSLTFEAAASYNTYVKLKSEDGSDILSFYARAGQSTKVRVPTGKYYLYMAHGYDWYGPELAFGADTVYEKEEQIFDFYTYTWTYTMEAGPEGNGVSITISEDEF